MEINLTKTRNINLDGIFRKAAGAVSRRSHWFLFSLALALLSYCGYVWYEHIYRAEWDENKKQEYLGTKEKEVIFNKDRFDRVMAELERRKGEYQKNIEDVPDIFRIE